MKFTDDEAERRFLKTRDDRALLQSVTKADLINAQIKIEKLLNERRKAIRKAYLKLPPPSKYVGRNIQYLIPYERKNTSLVLVTTDFQPDEIDCYAFTMCDGRWVMTEEEYNKHLYKGLIV
jgi:hypothetical protein